MVLCVHQLYARLKGGRPVLASFRPLLQTDEAKVLSALANKTDWLVFAAPGPLGLVAQGTINKTLRFVGRGTLGGYGLYAYAADNLFPVRKHFDEYFRRTPIATLPPEKSVDILVAKAQQSGHAVLFAGTGGVQSHVAAMVALDVALEDQVADEQSFVLSLDDLGWTRAWLGEGVRADFLIVRIRTDKQVLFRVVESKSKDGGDQVPCEQSQSEFGEGLSQVGITLTALEAISTAKEPSLDEDLRFSSLVEHLLAAILAKSEAMKADTRKAVFDAVNALSRRESTVTFEGVVVLTQGGVNKPRVQKTLATGLRMVWSGAPDVNRAFGVSGGDAVRSAARTQPFAPASQPPTLPSDRDSRPGPGVVLQPSADVEPTSRAATRTESESNAKAEQDTSAELELARGFILAARIHGIAVPQTDPSYLLLGPSLLAFGVKLREGASIAPLKQRLSDIARDIGMGNRANEIDVENDAEPRTVRVLLPRINRIFPPLPIDSRPLFTAEGYLPLLLGQTVIGEDFSAPLESWPHLLVAGSTGSGKTTFLRSLLVQLGNFDSRALRVCLVDGKGDTDYLGLLPPKMFANEFPEVQLGPKAAVDVLRWAVEEMERRRLLLVDLAKSRDEGHGVKASDLFRHAIEAGATPKISPLVIVIDEFADIMLAEKKSSEEFEILVQRIAQVGRSRLVHLVLATQRPDKETIRGAIKANLNARAVFRLPTQADSMTVLGHAGAERLMMYGDMLFQMGSAVPRRLQGYRV